jgi:hypothetical protein
MVVSYIEYKNVDTYPLLSLLGACVGDDVGRNVWPNTVGLFVLNFVGEDVGYIDGRGTGASEGDLKINP